MMHRGEAGHPSETAGENMARERGTSDTARSGMTQRRTIPGPPNFANPRQMNRMMPGGARQFSSTRGGNLAWSPNARNIPRAGNLQTGRPGALDPGGYTRSAGGRASSLINPKIMLVVSLQRRNRTIRHSRTRTIATYWQIALIGHGNSHPTHRVGLTIIKIPGIGDSLTGVTPAAFSAC